MNKFIKKNIDDLHDPIEVYITWEQAEARDYFINQGKITVFH